MSELQTAVDIPSQAAYLGRRGIVVVAILVARIFALPLSCPGTAARAALSTPPPCTRSFPARLARCSRHCACVGCC